MRAAAALGAVAFLAGAAPAAATPAAGRTSQQVGRYGAQRLPSNAVSFALVGGRIARFSVPWVATCDNPFVKADQPVLLDRMVITDRLRLRKGRFDASGSYSFPPGQGQSASIDFILGGTVRGRLARGTLRIDADLSLGGQVDGGDCETKHAIRWRAVIGSRAGGTRAPRRRRPRPPFTGMVAYARSDDGGATSALWAISPGGVVRPLRLTAPTDGASDSAPALATRPTAMTYQRTSGGVSQLYLADPEALGTTYKTALGGGRLTNVPQGASHPAVFAKLVAFSAGTGADCSLWVIAQNGTQARRLTDHGGAPGCDDLPAWSPDGRQLAFRRTVTDAAGAPLSARWLVVSLSGGAPRPLDFGSAVPGAIAWAPGPRFAYVGSGELGVMNSDGSGRRTILRDPALTGRPAWSPVGDQIAVVVRRADRSTDLTAVPARGGSPADITDTPGRSESDPVWSFPVPSRFKGGGSPGVHVHSQSRSR